MLATPPADCLRGPLVGRSLVEFALQYCQVLIELAKPRQIAAGQLHPRRGMTAGPEEEIALLMRRWKRNQKHKLLAHLRKSAEFQSVGISPTLSSAPVIAPPRTRRNSTQHVPALIATYAVARITTAAPPGAMRQVDGPAGGLDQ